MALGVPIFAERGAGQIRAAAPAPCGETTVQPLVEKDKHDIPYTGLAGLGAFLLGLVGVGWRDRRTLRIRTIAEVAQGLEIPVVGMCSSQTALPRNLPWYEASNDRVDAVRVLLTSPSRGTRQVVLVTSAVGQEGATSLAAASWRPVSLARAAGRC